MQPANMEVFTVRMGKLLSPACLFTQCVWTLGCSACVAQRTIKEIKIFICFLHFLVRKNKATCYPCPAHLRPWEMHCLNAPFRNKFSRKGCGGDGKFQLPGLEGTLPLENFKGPEIKQVKSSWVTFSFWNQTGYKCQAGVQPVSPRWTDSYLK